MKRLEELRRFVTKDSLGMEVAPYFNPVVPKSEGYNCLVLDVFDTETLRKHAEDDPNIVSERYNRIEDVDVVSDASRLKEVIAEKDLTGKLNYIVSSHNFEHLPDPISFLQGCSVGLVPGGVLAMAVPDGRACFDHFRMPTRLSAWLGAYHRGVTQPTPETIFDFRANVSDYLAENGEMTSFSIERDTPDGFTPTRSLRAAYDAYLEAANAPGEYQDSHCSVFFGASLELMLRDLKFLGVIDLEVVDVSETNGMEFYVHLRKPKDASTASDPGQEAAFFTKRESL